jgi:hypothetical protein
MANLIEAIQRELNRVRAAVLHYEELGPVGAFGAAMLKQAIVEGESAIASGDVVRMVEALNTLQNCAD